MDETASAVRIGTHGASCSLARDATVVLFSENMYAHPSPLSWMVLEYSVTPLRVRNTDLVLVLKTPSTSEFIGTSSSLSLIYVCFFRLGLSPFILFFANTLYLCCHHGTTNQPPPKF